MKKFGHTYGFKYIMAKKMRDAIEIVSAIDFLEVIISLLSLFGAERVEPAF